MEGILSRLNGIVKQLSDLEDPLHKTARSFDSQELLAIEQRLRSTRANLSIIISDIKVKNI